MDGIYAKTKTSKGGGGQKDEATLFQEQQSHIKASSDSSYIKAQVLL